MKVSIISGSSRGKNNTVRVAYAIEKVLKKKETEEINVIDFKEYDIPFFNEKTLQPDNLSKFQQKLVAAVDRAQLVFILSPEYNWFPSAEIINMVHQLGQPKFKHLFSDKVFSLCGVSSGRGGRVPAIQMGYVLDKLFNVFNTGSITCPKKFESQFTTRVLDEAGNSLGNTEYDKGLLNFVEYSLNTAQRWNS